MEDLTGDFKVSLSNASKSSKGVVILNTPHCWKAIIRDMQNIELPLEVQTDIQIIRQG